MLKRLFIPAPAGCLEALLLEPARPRGAALICHPHPLHGGTMHTKVVYRAARGLGEAGCTVLRFNFRGVGHSDGVWDAERGERRDADAALDWLAQSFPDLPLLVGGFSFGAFMGLQAGLQNDRSIGLLGLGLPLDRYRFDFLQDRPLPLLLVSGAQDPFCPPEQLQDLARRLGSQVETHILPSDGHLLVKSLDAVQNLVAAFATRCLDIASA
jgi:hypothetical protein